MAESVNETTSTAPLVQRVRHELKLRELDVAHIEPLGPGFVAITFTGAALADFTSLSFDDHVKFMLPGADGEQIRRDYTPRRYSRADRTLTIEFALHGDGAASDWARRAVVGQPALIGGPRGSMIYPLELDWHLLIGDATALPAIARRLEELPADARALVLLQADAHDRRTFLTGAQADVRWFGTPAALLDGLQSAALPDGAGFAWGGGEAGLMVGVREALAAKGVPRERMRVSAYWKRGVADHHENLA
jgi:NADPH-dependent ferric siderophore reductase